MFVQTWADVIRFTFQNMWTGFVLFLPSFLGALVIFFVGLVIAAGIGKIVEKLIDALKLDRLLEQLGLGRVLERADVRLHSGRFVGVLIQWFFIVVTLLAVSDILKLEAFSDFLSQVLLYVPNIVIAVLIMLAGVVTAAFLAKLVRASVMAARLHAAHFLGTLTKWSVLIFAFLAALSQLGVAGALVNTLIMGFVAMLAIAGGLAFGLGGKDVAAAWLEKMKSEISNR
ncbi:MAG: CmpX protein [Candidatus Azambacteria bacterium GW2011_GWC2_45_7b]|uniref:CmpX protein n=1 Tax=Candidatus Azambacteria bacterium GW2011_GWC2_45_7b TaxID=1618621 RepID=A0A837IIC3_9BACT|nr:MAG: CmpX protein [Candidatus Azambacteria bacterium GW2011_GWC2_45_7b]